MVTNYLKVLLFEHDCVVLSNFGGFITQYVSAEIHPITHKFQPPSKRVAFNEQLKSEDGLLVAILMKEEGLSKEDTLKVIADFVKSIKASLKENGNYDLKDIGRFFINKENQLQFDTDLTQNYLEDSYSLPELFFKPIERTSNSMNKLQKPVKKKEVSNEEYIGANDAEKKFNPAVILLPLFLLVIGAATAFLYFNQENQSLASVNPFVMFGEQKELAETKPEVLKASAESAVESTSETTESTETITENSSPEVAAEPVSEPEEVLTVQKGRFFIVAGSFKSKKNAMKLREKLEGESVSATILEPNETDKFYRVSLADFDTKEDAKEKLKELTPNYGKKIWILTY